MVEASDNFGWEAIQECFLGNIQIPYWYPSVLPAVYGLSGWYMRSRRYSTSRGLQLVVKKKKKKKNEIIDVKKMDKLPSSQKH